MPAPYGVIERLYGFVAAATGWFISFTLWRWFTVTELLHRKVLAQRHALQVQNASLASQKLQLEQIAQHDPLTGLLNRRAFEHQAGITLKRAHRDGSGLAALMVDLDHFKRVNDTYGHPVGDEVIARVGDVLRASVRESDLIARVGGEEFMALLPVQKMADAVEVAEKIRLRMAHSPVRLPPPHLPLTTTVSVGVAYFAEDQIGDFASLYAAADQALYAAKRSGRNQVKAAMPAPEPQGAT